MAQVVGKSARPREYWLSVRLSQEDLNLYMRMLKWYDLTPDLWEGNRSDRFRSLLYAFSEGLDHAQDLSRFYETEEFVTLPPQWRRRKEAEA